MQQAILAEQSTVDTHGTSTPGAAALNAFVVNLCSSTSPVALTPPDHAGLKRFSFFVSRRREESRERFRLHMGYFASQEEAEKLLDIVREIYPGAWAGLAPGQRLRAAALQGLATAAATSAREVAPAQLEPQFDSTPAAAAVPLASALDAQIPAPPAATAAVAAAHAVTTVIQEPALLDAAALALVPDEGRRLPDGQIIRSEAAAARSLHEVRAAIASLDDSSEPPPVLRPIPELKPAGSVSSATGTAAATGVSDDGADVISDRGVLAVLERGAAAPPTASSAPRSPASALAGATPSTEATGSTATMAVPAAALAAARAGKSAADEAPPRHEKPCFAVQLMWSVQPMDIAQVPQLAIFGAYTLYGAEGNRDGRRWYGLRLGFFTDAVSAKQVAHYVRSEFSTVSVVPVTARERARAEIASGRPSVSAPATAKTTTPTAAPKSDFQFIEDKELALPQAAKLGNGGRRPARAAPGKRARLRTQSAVNGRARTKPMTLEETLEILGAGELKMDDGREPLINDRGAAQPRPKPATTKPSRLGRLFERLSERIGS